jgi:hypothetical protein
MKCRIFYKDDVVHAVNVPSAKYQGDMDNCKVPDDLVDCSVMVMDLDEVPQVEHSVQLHLDAGVLKSDTAWEKTLMPDALVKMKHLTDIESSLDEKLASDSPDVVTVLRLQREVDISNKEAADNSNKSLYWAGKALEGLDRAEIDKPAIRTKLEANIVKLK